MRCYAALAAAALSLAPASFANLDEFVATLDGAQAVPAVVTGATGDAEMHYDAATNMIDQLHVFVEGIFVADLLGAHIGVGAPGVSGPVAFVLQNSWWGDTVSGMQLIVHLVGPLAEADEAQLFAGNGYIAIATDAHPGGEIRGQLTFVPAPGSLALGAIGAGLLARRRRR